MVYLSLPIKIKNNQMVVDSSPALPPFRQAASRLRCVGQAAKHSACSACSATRAAAPGATRRVQRRIAVGLGKGCSPTLFMMFKDVSWRMWIIYIYMYYVCVYLSIIYIFYLYVNIIVWYCLILYMFYHIAILILYIYEWLWMYMDHIWNGHGWKTYRSTN